MKDIIIKQTIYTCMLLIRTTMSMYSLFQYIHVALSIFFKCTSTLYFTIYRWYFILKFEHFHEYLIHFVQYSLKSGGTKYHFKWVKIHGTASY